MKTIVQTRIDSSLRQEAASVLKLMGMSLNDAIRIFLQQVVNERALPFRPSLGNEPNEMLKKRIDEIKGGKDLMNFESVGEFSEWLDSEGEE